MRITPPDPVDQKVQELRELFDHLDRRYLTLVANFQMLKPLIEDNQLKERLDDPCKRLGAGIIATALFNACVLDACVLLRVPQSRERPKAGTKKYPNLALADVIEPLLTENRPLLNPLPFPPPPSPSPKPIP